MSSTTVASPANSPGGDFRFRSNDPLVVLMELSRRALKTDKPRVFGHQAAMAAARLLRATHFAWAEASADAAHLTVTVEAGLHQRAFNDRHQFTMPVRENDCPFAQAMRLGCAVSAADNAGKRLDGEFLGGLDFAAALVGPLKHGPLVFGSLAVLDRAPRRFDEEQISLLTAIADLVTSALSRCESEQALQRERALSNSLRDSMDAVMFILDGQGRIAMVNQAGCQATGFAAGELLGRPISSAILLPEDFVQFKQSLARVQRNTGPERFESYLLTKEGQRRRIAWSIVQLPAERGTPTSLLATGVDITDRCEAVERAVRAENLAEEVLQSSKAGGVGFASVATVRRLPAGVEHDRRARPRRDYPYLQRMAPLYDDQLPVEAAFRELQCRDISSRGFAFLSPLQLECEKVVVAFGTPPAVVYLTAEIRHRTEMEVNGRKQYVIGCRYTGRVTK